GFTPAGDQVILREADMNQSKGMRGTLAVVFLFVAMGRADEGEEKAVAAIEKLGGRVNRDQTKPGHPVVVVNLEGSKVTDAALRQVGELRNLRELHLDSTGITDAGLKELAPLGQLRELHLINTKVTDAALKHLGTLT